MSDISQWTPDSPAASDGSQDHLDSRDNADVSRSGTELEAIAVQATCGQCWAYPNRPCRVAGTGTELHYARYQRANTKGVITDDELNRALTLTGEGNYVYWGKEGA